MYPVLFSIANFELRASSLFLFLGILSGILIGYKETKRVNISSIEFHLYWISAIPIALFLAAINGFVFWNRMRKNSGQLEDILSYGLVSYGAILGMLLLGYLLTKIRKTNTALFLDTVSLILPLILAIYRIGCILNGCCYGLETDSFLGIMLPDSLGVLVKRYPTQIWLMVFNFSLFTWLWLIRKKKSFDGILTIYFLILYSVGRLIIDIFRDLPRVFGPLSFHQLLAITILLTTLYAYAEIYFARRSVVE